MTAGQDSAQRSAMAEMAQRRRPLSCLFHRPDPHRGDAARHRRCRRIHVPGVPPPAAGALPAGPGEARPRAICRRRSRPRSITISRTGSAASMSNTCTRATARPGSAIRRRAGSGAAPRSAACPAKSRARCCAAGTPTTASSLGNPKLGFVCTKQSVDGQDGLEGYYYEYDHRARARSAPGVRAPSRSAAVRSRQGAGVAGRKLAEAAAGKGLSQLRDGICADRGARDGAIVRPRGCRLSAAPHRQADRHAVFRRDRARLRRAARRRQGVSRVPARAVRGAG